MQVTVLIENSANPARPDLRAEHGLSLHVVWSDRALLFDTGSSGAFFDNAQALGVDLCAIECVVLSHHHYDHGGGLKRFLGACPGPAVYLAPGGLASRWFRALGLVKREIGLDPSLFRDHGDRFREVGEYEEVFPGVYLLGSISRNYPAPRGNRFLYEAREGRLHHDPFEHERILVVRDGDGLVVFTGCSHNGIRNMVDQVVKRFPGEPIRAVFGGFHLVGLPIVNTMAESRREVEALGEALLQYPVARYITGHCTGPKAFRVLKEVMGDRLEAMATGLRVEV